MCNIHGSKSKVQLAFKVVAIEAEKEGEDADRGEGKLEVAAPNQEDGVTQAQETTCRMAIVACSVEQGLAKA